MAKGETPNLRPSEKSVSPEPTVWVAPVPSSVTEGPCLKGCCALAAGVPGFGSTMGVESGSANVAVWAGAPLPPGMRSRWPVRTE
jgi:hypothetical protein